MIDEIDRDKLEEAALAILGLTMFQDGPQIRAWKSLDWKLTDRLFERGWIHDPKGKAKSVGLTDEGAEKAREFLREHFGREPAT